ncbi:MAG: hypothetical protein IKW63_02020 [Elusimicrobiaceae bacterium]|nr:hypothetical protein [Elusimicrobiaceae bacterium]
MKKLSLLVLAAVCLVGCSSVGYHNAKSSMLLNDINKINTPSFKADVEVGEKISGVAECESWFGFTTKQPARQTYEAKLQSNSGNLAPSACTRGALYDAMSKSNADVIITPKYTSVNKDNWCVFGYCIHKVRQIIVTGYKGTVKKIAPMAKEDFEVYGVLTEVQKNNKASEASILGL